MNCGSIGEVFTCLCGKSMVRYSQNFQQKRMVSNIVKKTFRKKRDTAYENLPHAERIYAWGNARTGALGIPSYLLPKTNRKQFRLLQMCRPARVRFLTENKLKVKLFDCGYGYTMLVLKPEKGSKESLFGCGINTDSQIGYHTNPKKKDSVLDYIIYPAKIQLPFEDCDTKIIDISCGRAHSLVLTDKEGVFSFGNNAYGQCGRKVIDEEIYSGSHMINNIKDLPSNIIKVLCGQDHSLFLTSTGEVYSCGLGADGQTGLQHFKTEWRPTRVLGDIEGEKIIHLSSKGDFVLAVSDKGDLFGWGNSEYNQLAMITDEAQVSTPRHLRINQKIRKTAAAGSMCAVLTEKCDVMVWGFGLLGVGPGVENAVNPTLIPPTLFGRNEMNPESFVTDLSCGINHFMALTNCHEIYAWGRNSKGCLGIYSKSEVDQSFPMMVSMPAEPIRIACGVDHTVAMCKAFC